MFTDTRVRSTPWKSAALILANLPDDNYVGHSGTLAGQVIPMKRHVRLFLLYFAQYAKVRMAYKADFIIAFFSSMAATVLGFGFVLVLFSKIPRLQDWSFNEVMFLYGFSLIPLGLFNVVSWNLYEFGEIYIIEGQIRSSACCGPSTHSFKLSLRSFAWSPCRRW